MAGLPKYEVFGREQKTMYHVYVLECQSQTGRILYVGSTGNFERRTREHLFKRVKTTKKFDKITLIYFEVCLNKTDARKRELQLKTGFGRGYLNRRLENYFKMRE